MKMQIKTPNVTENDIVNHVVNIYILDRDFEMEPAIYLEHKILHYHHDDKKLIMTMVHSLQNSDGFRNL